MEIHTTAKPFYTRGPFKATLLLLAVSAAVKIPLLTLKWGVIAGDDVTYVLMAKTILQMDFKAVLSSTAVLPFYPLLIAFFHAIGGSWATSAIMVSFLSGWLAVIPFYLLTARIFDERVALIASFFFILSPNMNLVSTAIGSDAAFILLLTLGIWIIWLAYESRNPLYWGGAIALALITTLTRNSGVALFPLSLFWMAHSYRRDIKGSSKSLLIILLCLAAIAALLFVCVLYIGQLPGKVYPILSHLTDLSYLKVERVSEALRLAEQSTSGGKYFDFFEMARHYIHIIYMMGIVDLLIRACGKAIFPLIAIGLFWRTKQWEGHGRAYLFTIALLFILMNYAFLLMSNYTEARYLLPAAIALFPIGAQGYIRLEGYLERHSINPWIVAVIVAILVVGRSGYKFNSIRKNAAQYSNLKDSISWVKHNTPSGAMIVTNDPGIPLSAERTYLKVECPNLDKCMKPSALKGADYIVYRDVDKGSTPGPYEPEKVFRGGRFDIYVFKASG